MVWIGPTSRLACCGGCVLDGRGAEEGDAWLVYVL